MINFSMDSSANCLICNQVTVWFVKLQLATQLEMLSQRKPKITFPSVHFVQPIVSWNHDMFDNLNAKMPNLANLVLTHF